MLSFGLTFIFFLGIEFCHLELFFERPKKSLAMLSFHVLAPCESDHFDHKIF
jgi:hypothetical protein